MPHVKAPLKILVNGVIKGSYPIMVLFIAPSSPEIEKIGTKEQGDFPITTIGGITITTSADSVIFSQSGRWFTTLNYGHLRTIIRLDEVSTVAKL